MLGGGVSPRSSGKSVRAAERRHGFRNSRVSAGSKWETSPSCGAGVPNKRRFCACWGGGAGGSVLQHSSLQTVRQYPKVGLFPDCDWGVEVRATIARCLQFVAPFLSANRTPTNVPRLCKTSQMCSFRRKRRRPFPYWRVRSYVADFIISLMCNKSWARRVSV